MIRVVEIISPCSQVCKDFMAPVLVHTCPYKERKTHNVVPAYKRPQLSGNGCTLRPTCKKEKRAHIRVGHSLGTNQPGSLVCRYSSLYIQEGAWEVLIIQGKHTSGIVWGISIVSFASQTYFCKTNLEYTNNFGKKKNGCWPALISFPIRPLLTFHCNL